jgi:glycosyltransferase involved in cell wall biosynthesis
MDVTVMLLNDAQAEHGHYEKLLRKAGVKLIIAGKVFDEGFPKAAKKIRGLDVLMQSIPQEFCPWAIDAFGELLANPADIVHCWLDHPNIWGGVGAVLAEVPLLVLSTRNVNPSHFPQLSSPYFHAMYYELIQSDSIRIINNSHAGAEDYASWLGVEKSRFHVVLNGVDLSGISRASPHEINSLRSEIALGEKDRVIAGVFRLSEEKQPLVFLEVARQILRAFDDVCFVVAGIGPMEEEMRTFITTHGLESRVRLIGRRSDVQTLFSLATLSLLCSRQEGTPNVLLESQWLGCPVVATKAGGVVDAVSHNKTGLLVDVGDVRGIVNATIRLLSDNHLRAAFSMAGPDFINATFGLERMVAATNNVYLSR